MDHQNLGIANDSANGYQAYGQQFWADPTALAQKTEDKYRSFMMPEFDNTYNQAMGDATAGLGNRYGSTFGQLTLGGTASNLGRARAGVEKDIYDAGQASVDNQINRLGNLGNIATLDQARMVQNIPNLMSGYSGVNNALGNYNNALNNRYSTQANVYANQDKRDFLDRYAQFVGANAQIASSMAGGP